MTMNRTRAVSIAALLLLLAGGGYLLSRAPQPSEPVAQAPEPDAPAIAQTPIIDESKALLASYRKIIVLLADEKTLPDSAREPLNRVGQELFHASLLQVAQLEETLRALISSGRQGRFDTLAAVLDYIESGADMFDADRLAFRELLRALHQAVSRDGSLQAVRLHKRIGEDLDALAEIERAYEKEIGQIFNRFDARAIVQKRERWEDYVARLQQIYSRDQVLKDHGVVLPYPAAKAEPKAAVRDENEIYGNKLPAKTVVLTFDDGPHRQYTEEIAAILKLYGVPAVFFKVGRNLGTTDANHKATLSVNGLISRKLKASGFEIANHSYSHAQLSKQTGDALKAEILNTDALLKAVDADRSPLFRFPYGARNNEGLKAVEAAQLRSVMWNIDSLD